VIFLQNLIILILASVLAAMVSGNNVPIIAGPLKYSRAIRKASSIICISGLIVGYLLEGWKMEHSLRILFIMINSTYKFSITILLISLIYLLANYYSLPISLTNILFASLATIYVLHQILQVRYMLDELSNAILYICLVIIAWIIIPLAVLGVTYLIYRWLVRIQGWNIYIFEKIVILLTTFLLSYTFSANTLGFLASITKLHYDNSHLDKMVILVAAILGYLLIERRVSLGLLSGLYSVGLLTMLTAQLITSLFLELTTQIGIPISMTQLLICSILGAGYARRVWYFNKRYLKKLLLFWIIAPFLGVLIGAISLMM